jgi:NADH dehydrogenase [ubiquinone] 1 alpha subcomplex assembly factor 3
MVCTAWRPIFACSATNSGFVVNNVHVPGSIMAYGSIWMMWKVRNMEEVTPESLALFHLIKPVPDLLIFGSGSKHGLPPTGTQQALQSQSIGLEALPTV